MRFKFSSVYFAPLDDELTGQAGGGDDFESNDAPADNAPADSSPAPYLRDMTEDDVYGILSKARHYDEQLDMTVSPLAKQLQAIEQRLNGFTPSTGQVDVEKLRAVLEKYDPGLAGLADALAEAIQFTPINKDTLAPYLEEIQSQFGDLPIGNQIVLSHYDAEEIASIVPPAGQDGNPMPQTQRHKDFLTWFNQQSPRTQQSMQSFGPNYVRALRKFETWEREQLEARKEAGAAAGSRLAGGVSPSAKGRSGGTTQPSLDDFFLQGFNDEG